MYEGNPGDVTQQRYWRSRLNAYGHTGWADRFIYAYDQLARLALMDHMLSVRSECHGFAVDFGSGVGDFSKLLLERGYTVCGLDPNVRPKINSPSFYYADSPSKIPFPPSTVDIIICVTVLDHILDDDNLRSALQLFRNLLKVDGTIYMLEYALTSDTARNGLPVSNGYQSFRTMDCWTKLFKQHSLLVRSSTPFSHPIYAPSIGYIEYSRSWLTRFLKRLARLPAGNCLIGKFLTWHAAKFVTKDMSEFNAANSPLRFIECVPIGKERGEAKYCA